MGWGAWTNSLEDALTVFGAGIKVAGSCFGLNVLDLLLV